MVRTWFIACIVSHRLLELHMGLSIFPRKSHRCHQERQGINYIPGMMLNIRKHHQDGTDIHYPFSCRCFCPLQIRALLFQNVSVPYSLFQVCRIALASAATRQTSAPMRIHSCASPFRSTGTTHQRIRTKYSAYASVDPCSKPSGRR